MVEVTVIKFYLKANVFKEIDEKVAETLGISTDVDKPPEIRLGDDS